MKRAWYRHVLVMLIGSTTIHWIEAWSFPSLLSSPPPKIVVKDHVQDSTAAFKSWCDKVGIQANKLEHSSNTIDGIPGIVVRRDSSLAAGECAIVLPVDAAIVVLASTNDMMDVTSPVPQYLSDETWKDAPPKLRLACVLLNERQKGDSSHYKGYIDHLPPVSGLGRERCDTLDRWSEAELRLLKSPLLVKKIKERAKLDNTWFGSLQQHQDLEENDQATPFCSRKEFDYCLDIVRTRAFAGDYSVPNNGQANDIALLPIVDDLNHRETLSSKNEMLEVSGTTNNAFPPVANVLGRTRTAICWVAHETHVSGNEVAHSYLHGTDGLAEEFLHQWGFTTAVLGANTLEVEGVPVVIRHDGRLQNLGPALRDIRTALMKIRNDETEQVSDSDIYKRIARACDAEARNFYTTKEKDDETRLTMPPHRLAIVQTYLDGKQGILRAGSEWAQSQAAKSSSKTKSTQKEPNCVDPTGWMAYLMVLCVSCNSSRGIQDSILWVSRLEVCFTSLRQIEVSPCKSNNDHYKPELVSLLVVSKSEIVNCRARNPV